MDEERYLTFKIFYQEKRTKMFLAVLLGISMLTNLVLAIGSCLN